MRRPPWLLDVLLILIVSGAANFSLLHDRSEYLFADSPSYLEPAWNLAQGRGFYAIQPPTYTVAVIPGYPSQFGPETLRTPLYSLLIAGFVAAGAPLGAVIVLQHLLAIATVIALYSFLMFATRSRPTALTAALIAGWFPTNAHLANQYMAETLLTALLLAAIIAAEIAIRKSSVPAAIAGGLALGAAVLTKPVAVYFAVVVAAVMLVTAQRRAALIVALLISSQLLPLVWTERNRRAAGVAMISSAANENLLFEWAAAAHVTRNESHLFRLTATQRAMGLRAPMHRAMVPLFEQAMSLARSEGADPARLTPAQKSVYMKRLALTIIARHPAAVAELVFSAVVEELIIGPARIATEYGLSERTAMLLTPLPFAALVLVVAGIRDLYRRNRGLSFLIAGTIAYFTLVSAIPETGIRYVAIFAPVYCTALAAGLGLVVPRAVLYIRAMPAAARARAAGNSGPA